MYYNANKLHVIAAAVAAVAAFSSCSQGENVFNDEAYFNEQKAKYEKSWKEKFGAIDPTQNWNMVSTTQTKVSMDITEDALSDYVLELYSDNPIVNPKAVLWGSKKVTTDANGKASASFSVVLPKVVETLYAVRRDSHNRRLVKLANVTANGVTASFGLNTTANLAKTRSLIEGDIPTIDCPYTKEQINSFISTAYDINSGKVPNMYWIQGEADLSNNGNIGGIGIKSETYSAILTGELTVGQSSLNLSNIWDRNTSSTTGNDSFVNSGRRVKLIVGEGGVLRFSGNADILGIDIIVANGGKVVFDQTPTLKSNTRIIVQAGGTVQSNAENIDYTTGELIYNDGTITAKKISTNFAPIYNATNGVITADEIYFANSTDGAYITNFGHVTVNNVTGNGNQGTFNNFCNLVVKNEFKVNWLNLGENSEIRCKSISFQGGATLRKNSILRCDEISMNLTTLKYVGAADGSALVSSKKVKYVNVGDGGFAIQGNIWFETDEYGTTDEEKYNFPIAIANAAQKGNILGVTKVGEANITIPADPDGCTGEGNTPSDGPDPTPNPYQWIIACEDLGSTDDYDFNDIVFGISYEAGSTTAYVTPLAAGGTLKANIMFGAQNLGEVHELLGHQAKEDGTYPMINTGRGEVGSASRIAVTVPSNFSLGTSMGGFGVVVEKGDQVVRIYGPETGKAPQMFLLQGDWEWPKERVGIEVAYPDFSKWNGNADDLNWCKKPQDGMVWDW